MRGQTPNVKGKCGQRRPVGQTADSVGKLAADEGLDAVDDLHEVEIGRI